jgi:imidazolonepropionase-like amidohydrolase
MAQGSMPAVSRYLAIAILTAAVSTAFADRRPANLPSPEQQNRASAQETADDRDKAPPPPGRGGLAAPNDDPFPSTYVAPPAPPFAIRNATVMTAAGPTMANATVLVENGRIEAAGSAVRVPAGAVVIDGTGKYVTPGLIDVHAHLGVYPSPGVEAHQDGNEATSPATPQVWAEHSVWPQDPAFPRVLEGGVTTLQALPGSANLFGGRSAVLKVIPARTVQAMKFPGAKYGLKMACGENPKRVYRQRGPSTRMGNVAGYREQWIKAERYRREWDAWLADRTRKPPERDLGLDTLAEVLRGNILVQNHCYRADEMAQMIDVAREFGYRIRSFHHAVEAYKLAGLLASEDIAASLWADWGAFKMESLDAIRANGALVHAAGARTVVHSDSAIDAQRLNQEAAKILAAGRAAGLTVTEDDAIKWITAHAAWTLGLDDRIGTIRPGRNADLVLWSANPFSVYARAEKVWIDGVLRFDRADEGSRWRTDFELGFVPAGGRQ